MACKFYKQKKQYSIDDGVTWIDVTPAEYRKGSLYELDSRDCEYVPPTPTGYSAQYFTTVARENAAFSFVKNRTNTTDIQYSLDSGSTWNTLTSGSSTPTVTTGNKVYWKGTLISGNGYGGIGIFSSTAKFDVEGNAMSLLYGDNYANKTSLAGKNSTFRCLFSGCTTVINAQNMVLPATTLTGQCYEQMFLNCSNLKTAPSILPALNLASKCYSNMFLGCGSLTTAPELPAETLARECYLSMFWGCSKLVTAPALPAETLAIGCYHNMFLGCGSLTTAPELPALYLVDSCYQGMFISCSSLKYIKCLATYISASDCTKDWLAGDLPSRGTFVKNANTTWPSGASGIPYGWTIQNA